MMLSHTIKLKTLIITAVIMFSSVMLVGAALASTPWLFSITDTDVPTRIALDSKGNIYVTEPRERNRVLVFNAHGKLLRTLSGQRKPIGIAVDSDLRLYVGNSDTGSVDVYNPDFSLSHRLGSGSGEFKIPNSIAVGKNGLVYVADNKANTIKVYHLDGSPAFSFGGWGKESGKFNAPLGLAIDETKAELYVTDMGVFDDPAYGQTAGARVQVFDLNGSFKRSFGEYGTGEGKMIRPLGIAVDAAGKLYITDTFQAVVHVFDGYGVPIETIYDLAHPLKTPIGIAVGRDNRLFVASSNGASVEVFGLAGYTDMSVTPASLSFEAAEGGLPPAPQTITVTNSGTGTLSWTVAADAGWIAPFIDRQMVYTTGPNSSTPLQVSVDPTGLRAGVYTGKITITASTGATDTVTLRLMVTTPPALLGLSPTSLTFKVQQNGPTPPSQTMSIVNLRSGEMSWTAKTSHPWITLTTTSGKAPATVPISITTNLPLGTSTGSITVTALGAQGSPADVKINVQVIYAGTVKVITNLEQASFEITGPITYTGAGKSWSNDEMPPGTYTITFKHITGYFKPQPKSFIVTTGKESVIQAEYRKKPVATHIIAGAAKGKKVIVLTPEGTQVSTFEPFSSTENIRVSAGNLDGSGADEIIVTDTKRSIKVYSLEGAELAAYTLPEGYKHTELAAADITNDGKAEIIVGTEKPSAKHDKEQRIVKHLTYAPGKLEDKSAPITLDKDGRFTLALADINGDLAPELLMADEHSLQAYTIQTTPPAITLTQLWEVSGDYGDTPQIAAGDINDDEAAEIAISYEQDGDTKGAPKHHREMAVIRVLKATGEDFGLTFAPFSDKEYEDPATLAIGDIDADGVDEIVAGAGKDEHAEPLIRIFKTGGSFTAIEAMEGKGGVNVGIGRF